MNMSMFAASSYDLPLGIGQASEGFLSEQVLRVLADLSAWLISL